MRNWINVESADLTPAAIDQRVVRVFISSTFRDMFRERDILVKRIFPQLRKLCEERFVTWGEVDLRRNIRMLDERIVHAA